jgi:DNA primase
MSVDAARGLYHCFGCGKSGDLFRFVQDTQMVDFSDAVEVLARRSGITLHEDAEASKRRDRRQTLVDASVLAVEFYHDSLKTGRDAGGARGYLRGRGYDGEVVDRFLIGYSPPHGEALVGHLRRRNVPEDVMVTAGLAVRARTGKVFDRFRGRVMFPIYDVRGDAVGFGARLLEGGEGPKYLNSPETPIYHKSSLLYGLNWAKSEIVRGGQSVVVEGYTDVIGLHLAGMPVAVATCGTALGEEHLDLLRRFSERVVLMFDADEAGTNASLRGFERSVPGDLDLRVAALPEGRDPADVVAAGELEVLKAALSASTPLLQFRLERLLEGFDLSEPEARGRAVRAAADVVARHPDRVTRHEYGVLVSRRTGVELDIVVRAVEAAVAGAQSPRPTPPHVARPLDGVEKAERDLLRLLLANDSGVRRHDLTGMFSRDDHRAAYELLVPVVAALDPGMPPDLGSLLGDDDGEVAVMLRGLAFLDSKLPTADEVVRKVQVGALERRIEETKLRVEQFPADSEAYTAGFQELIALERRRRELASQE